MRWAGSFLLLLAIFRLAAGAAYEITPATSPITIDGQVTEKEWNSALALQLRYETSPGENIAAPIRTRCFLAYDKDFLYAAFVAEDPNPNSVRAHYSDRDNIPRDDYLGLVLDTFHDERRAFEFFVNPLGVQLDMTFDDIARTEDSSWDAIWRSAGRLTDKGYEVELAIPFTSLRFKRKSEKQTWGIDIVRFLPRNKRHRIGLHPIDRNRNCYLCQNETLSGFEGVLPGHNMEIAPTLTANRTDNLPEGATSLQRGSIHWDAGVSTRWGVTPNLNLNGTLNPDFSQVEADVAQLDVNSRFALFFPEKRTFFLEGADIFSTIYNVVYTRTIADPQWGIKFTGKEETNAIGVIAARDSVTNLLLPSNQFSYLTSLDQEATSVIGRYRRDVWSGSTLGVLTSFRQGGNYSNMVLGGDGLIRIKSTDSIRFQGFRSQTRYPEQVVSEFDQPAGSFPGYSGSLRYRHNARDWFWAFSYDNFDTHFRDDIGFIPRVDTQYAEGDIERIFYSNTKWYSNLGLGFSASRITNHDGLLTDENIGPYVYFEGPLQSYLNASVSRQREYFNGVLYDTSNITWFFNIRPTGQFTSSIGGTVGNAVDHINSQPANILRLQPGFTLNIGRHWYIQGDHDFQHLTTNTQDIFTANLAQLRLVYQFNVRIFVRAILQYTDIRNNVSAFKSEVDPHFRRFFGQYLFSYKLNPQTVVFLGYSDAQSEDSTAGLRRTDRTFFIKVGYAWVL